MLDWPNDVTWEMIEKLLLEDPILYQCQVAAIKYGWSKEKTLLHMVYLQTEAKKLFSKTLQDNYMNSIQTIVIKK